MPASSQKFHKPMNNKRAPREHLTTCSEVQNSGLIVRILLIFLFLSFYPISHAPVLQWKSHCYETSYRLVHCYESFLVTRRPLVSFLVTVWFFQSDQTSKAGCSVARTPAFVFWVGQKQKAPGTHRGAGLSGHRGFWLSWSWSWALNFFAHNP